MVSAVTQEVHKIRVSVKPTHEFFEGDIMGIEPPRRCNNCRKCEECLFRNSELSQIEQYQYQVMESKVRYDENQHCSIYDIHQNRISYSVRLLYMINSF